MRINRFDAATLVEVYVYKTDLMRSIIRGFNTHIRHIEIAHHELPVCRHAHNLILSAVQVSQLPGRRSAGISAAFLFLLQSSLQAP